MIIIINGKNFEYNSEIITISQIVDELQIATVGTAIAVGSSVVPRASWGEYSLCEGDKVTIIKATQGG